MNHDECEHFDPECGDNDFDDYLVTPRAPFYVQDKATDTFSNLGRISFELF